ncbi:MAG: hypothetical protein OFPI_01790 [Osedax symbiont Rs2]|nr:MAG: hypothetical protein OFPI_01790 [Osedax symbiont Rs2]
MMSDTIFQTLHIINKTSSHSDLYTDCFKTLLPGDAILLIEGAVYSACGQQVCDLLKQQVPLYALNIDIQARGLTQRIHSQVISIDDDTFVSLTCQYKKSISWF